MLGPPNDSSMRTAARAGAASNVAAPLSRRRGGRAHRDVGHGAVEWGHRVDARAAQRLVDEYSGAGGSVIELPSTGDSSAVVIAQLRLPEEILMMARVGVSMSEPDHIDVGLGRSRV